MHSYDFTVIGAGPAGAVASSWLRLQGYTVLVLERETYPRFQIGESLLPCCMQQLEEAQLLDAVKEQKFQVKTGAAFHREDKKCEFLFDDQFTKDAWTWTWQVKRADFDYALIQEAARKGVVVQFECEVKAVEASLQQQQVTYIDKNGVEHITTSRFLIDASGYGRVLPRLFNLSKPSAFKPRGAVFSHLEDAKRSEKASKNIFVHSFNENSAWIWAIPFSDGSTSVGIVGDQEYVSQMAANNGERYKAFIQSFKDLENRFDDTSFRFEPRAILGYSVGVTRMFGDGFVLAGNSTEFLDPIFSSGVTFATSSGLLAAKLAHRQLSGESIDWLKEYEEVMYEGINVFRSYVAGWYNGDFQTIVFTDTIDPTFKQQICSVLAGYVWDKSNPFVKKHDTILSTLAQVIRLRDRQRRLTQ